MPSHCRVCPLIWTAFAAFAIAVSGCEDPTLIGYKIEPVSTGPIQAYGMTLDQQSSPQDVVYAMFRAVRDDIAAAQDHDLKAQLAAINVQVGLAASEWMHQHFQKSLQRKSMTVEVTPEQSVFKLIRFWAPMLGHYIDSVETEHDPAVAQMSVRFRSQQTEAEVLYNVSARDASQATIRVELLRESDCWRIKRISFAPSSLALPAAGQSEAARSESSPQPTNSPSS